MSIEVIAVRLTKGMDLKLSLAKLVEKHGIKAGSIASCVGCVSDLNLRLASAERTLTKQEPFEIVSVMGTLTPEHQHVHISVSDRDGRVWGGHLMEGTFIDTTAELIIHSYPELEFTRAMDGSTGYTELQVNHSK
ncbi:DNA-binding protein [Vibrio parahaemolyticus]|uniref:PPC domain-containing DNA-binding protein n=1 Tax=Vibrio diabolicus TaxID=50719 RepID=UPI0006B2A6E3|nr:PPC domain-containing DNA-binding protein [Vibrio diabolicus]KOY44955.1 DNA-binding protein [Vibrio parahaemolyticus]MCG9230302.1 DNA-binding protein [Vibrio diabolicus]MCG9572916.1 DNA-binding protein [Vibrio diabolicus]MCG9591633.1 DNA-binding protein [Vibrio diabolicus]MCG9774693.1 DNA-binding protein [Vibrio diabolicus]